MGSTIIEGCGIVKTVLSITDGCLPGEMDFALGCERAGVVIRGREGLSGSCVRYN